jgi:hypothetical protein
MKIINYFRSLSALKLFITSIVFVLISVFIEKQLPNLFLGLRLLAFILFFVAIVRLTNKK